MCAAWDAKKEAAYPTKNYAAKIAVADSVILSLGNDIKTKTKPICHCFK